MRASSEITTNVVVKNFTAGSKLTATFRGDGLPPRAVDMVDALMGVSTPKDFAGICAEALWRKPMQDDCISWGMEALGNGVALTNT